MQIFGIEEIARAKRRFPHAAPSLDRWQNLAKASQATNFLELKATFNAVDWVKPFLIFDISGNNFRLIAKVKYAPNGVFQIVEILSHAEYTRKYRR